MIKALSPNNVGLAFGALLGLFHLVWALLVAIGAAQFIIDWVFRLHMIVPVFKIAPFSFSLTLGLLAMVMVIGYVLGAIFALIWNKLHK